MAQTVNNSDARKRCTQGECARAEEEQMNAAAQTMQPTVRIYNLRFQAYSRGGETLELVVAPKISASNGIRRAKGGGGTNGARFKVMSGTAASTT